VRPIGGFLGKGDFGKLFDNPSLGRSPIAIENRAGWQPHGRGSAIVTNPISNNQIGGARDLLTTNASTEWGGERISRNLRLSSPDRGPQDQGNGRDDESNPEESDNY
jgi:hypothetical protein